MSVTADDVLEFWFVEHGPDDWYAGAAEFDAKCAAIFSDVHAQAVKGELWTWRASPGGRVAELILLDQMSRQFHRGDARAFASDTMALAIAQEGVAQGLDAKLDLHRRQFLYMPYMHSESLLVQDESVRLFEAMGEPQSLEHAVAHRDTIARFGRFPFRNAALGRRTTPEEAAYMAEREGKGY